MNLTPREKDKLLISVAAMVARRRLERGVKLNHPEAVALITDFILEGARDGRTVAELMSLGAQVLTADEVMDGIAELVTEHFDLRPGAFREYLNLHRPIYQKTAAYGHFGREDEDFTWERTDRADALREAAGLGEGAPAPA